MYFFDYVSTLRGGKLVALALGLATTKPTGQGTGLGLSLSYNIIKAHGGELKVETYEGEGAEFIIWLLT